MPQNRRVAEISGAPEMVQIPGGQRQGYVAMTSFSNGGFPQVDRFFNFIVLKQYSKIFIYSPSQLLSKAPKGPWWTERSSFSRLGCSPEFWFTAWSHPACPVYQIFLTRIAWCLHTISLEHVAVQVRFINFVRISNKIRSSRARPRWWTSRRSFPR